MELDAKHTSTQCSMEHSKNTQIQLGMQNAYVALITYCWLCSALHSLFWCRFRFNWEINKSNKNRDRDLHTFTSVKRNWVQYGILGSITRYEAAYCSPFSSAILYVHCALASKWLDSIASLCVPPPPSLRIQFTQNYPHSLNRRVPLHRWILFLYVYRYVTRCGLHIFYEVNLSVPYQKQRAFQKT